MWTLRRGGRYKDLCRSLAPRAWRDKKKNREEINFPYGPDDQREHLGDSKRMHMDSNVTVVNQFVGPSTRRCMREKEPADMEMDQSVHQDTDRTKPEETLAVKLTH